MSNNQTSLTSEQVKENYYRKLKQARIGNQLVNEERAIRAQREQDPALFNFIEALGNQRGLAGLKQLHVMLSRYIALSEYNGGKGQ